MMIGTRRVVGAERDLPAQRLLVGALEVAQRLGAGGVDPGVFDLLSDDLLLALALDVGQLELLAEDGRQLVERDVDLEGVLALALAGLLPVPGLDRPRRQLLARRRLRPGRRRPARGGRT